MNILILLGCRAGILSFAIARRQLALRSNWLTFNGRCSWSCIHAGGWLQPVLGDGLFWLCVPVLPTLLLGLPRRCGMAMVVAAACCGAFASVLPPMSDTEREAIEAGSVWWEAELFRGAPDWEQLAELPDAGSCARPSRPSWTVRWSSSAG